jgi:hypothetical protein
VEPAVTSASRLWSPAASTPMSNTPAPP